MNYGQLLISSIYCSKTGYFWSLQENHRKWIPWVADPEYYSGIASVLMLLPVVVRGLMWWSGNIHVPVLFGERLRKTNGEKIKCIILSHGLGGSRFLYSTICYELASQGFIVFALEHRSVSFLVNQFEILNKSFLKG